MTTLFDDQLLLGLATLADVVSAPEERSLIAAIDTSGLTPFRFQGWTGERLTTSFGFGYDFDLQRPVDADPMPAWLLPSATG